MTREEAKRRLLDIERCTPIHTREDARDFEALEMAIQALSQEPCGDAVSREDAIEAVKQAIYNHDSAIMRLTELPSVNPQPCDDTISRDAINNLQKYRYNCGETSITCVSLKSINELPPVTQKPETVTEFADRCRECGARYGKLLKQKSGHWIETEYHRWRCSVCREKGMSEWDNIHDVRTNFCSNCGAKMESEE